MGDTRTRNDGFLSITENGDKGIIIKAVASECENCDCYDCDYNCQECDNTD